MSQPKTPIYQEVSLDPVLTGMMLEKWFPTEGESEYINALVKAFNSCGGLNDFDFSLNAYPEFKTWWLEFNELVENKFSQVGMASAFLNSTTASGREALTELSKGAPVGNGVRDEVARQFKVAALKHLKGHLGHGITMTRLFDFLIRRVENEIPQVEYMKLKKGVAHIIELLNTAISGDYNDSFPEIRSVLVQYEGLMDKINGVGIEKINQYTMAQFNNSFKECVKATKALKEEHCDEKSVIDTILDFVKDFFKSIFEEKTSFDQTVTGQEVSVNKAYECANRYLFHGKKQHTDSAREEADDTHTEEEQASLQA